MFWILSKIHRLFLWSLVYIFPKFHFKNPPITFGIILLTHQRRTNAGQNIIPPDCGGGNYDSLNCLIIIVLKVSTCACDCMQDQYAFCYRAALEYLGSFDHYAN